MARVGIGIIGGGYMGKAHAAAYSAVGTLFNTRLRPHLEMISASSLESANRYCQQYGFAHAAKNWQELVNSPDVEAVIVASPQETHLEIVQAAFALKKPVFCEKPLGTSLEDAQTMARLARESGLVNMVGFNYIRTPASQYAHQLITDGVIGNITWFRGEHTEDFYADPSLPATWRTSGEANGTLGDLAPHMINAALTLIGPIASVMADVETVHENRNGEPVTNDDQAQLMCRFANGAMGHLYFSRIATGRKMGYIYEVTGTKGAIRMNQEDQNSLWLYEAKGPEEQRGFKQILTGPAHPNYLAFCQGPGHGTGYQDQIIIEARDFLEAVADGTPRWPTFEDGLAISQVVTAIRKSYAATAWAKVETS